MDTRLSAAIAQIHRDYLPAGGTVLDLAAGDARGSGDHPRLPYGEAEFDAATLHGGFDTLRDPIATLRETARVLRAGAPLIVTFLDRSPGDAVGGVWRTLDDGDARCGVVATTFRAAGAEFWSRVETRVYTALAGTPLYAVISRRQE